MNPFFYDMLVVRQSLTLSRKKKLTVEISFQQ